MVLFIAVLSVALVYFILPSILIFVPYTKGNRLLAKATRKRNKKYLSFRETWVMMNRSNQDR